MNKPREKRKAAGVYAFRLDDETEAILTRIAITEKRTKSEIIRRYIDMGIKNSGYRPDDERLGQLIRDALQEILKPNVERLASISAKAANIDAASFFLLLYVGKLMLPPSERQRVEEAAENARKLGIDYLKLRKDRDIDAFIQGGIKEMNDE
jgi:hypothetical protein